MQRDWKVMFNNPAVTKRAQKRDLKTRVDSLTAAGNEMCPGRLTATLNHTPAGSTYKDGMDCVPRAISELTGISFNEVTERLGRKPGDGFTLPCRFTIGGYGFDFQLTGFKDPKNQELFTLHDVGNGLTLPEKAMIESPGHVFAVINNHAYDLTDKNTNSGVDGWFDQELYGWWTAQPVKDSTAFIKAGPSCCRNLKKVY